VKQVFGISLTPRYHLAY